MLSPHIAGVRNKECPTVLALALSHRTCHGPASPQVHDRLSAAWMEENGAGKDGESRRKKREEIEKNGIGCLKTERRAPRGSPYPVDSSFRSPLTIVVFTSKEPENIYQRLDVDLVRIIHRLIKPGIIHVIRV